jgi:hypothetical protein
MVIDGKKKCGKCKMIKEINNFYRNTNLGDGWAYYCKDCSRTIDIPRGKRYFKENQEKVHARHVEWFRNHPGKSSEYNKKSDIKYPERRLAKQMVNNAIQSGRLIKQPCQVCSELKVHGHHDDYYKPLEVMWLCIKHHRQIHEGINEWKILFNKSNSS